MMNLAHITIFGLIFSLLVGIFPASGSSIPVVANAAETVGIAGSDFRKQGQIAYHRLDGKIVSSTGCEVAYSFYQPNASTQNIIVVLAHGFMRSRSRMAHMVKHLASWGLAVASVEFCNSKWWAGNHDLNGADMVAVARELKAKKVIYAGFSAGGLAAVVAAYLDKKAIAVFGLDMVDNKGLGKKTAPQLGVPFFGLMAAPSACNANNNGLDVYAVSPDSCVIKIEDAGHCHFEFPMDGKCTFVCSKGENQFSREMIQQTILGLTTAFLLWQTNIDENGRNWWGNNEQNHEALVDAGYIEKLINIKCGAID